LLSSAKSAFRTKQPGFRSLAESTPAAKSILEQGDKQPWVEQPHGLVWTQEKEDGDDHEHDLQRTGAANHNRAIIGAWSGGQLEALVGGLHHLAHRAGCDRPALSMSDRALKDIGLNRSEIPRAVKGEMALIALAGFIIESSPGRALP
jgi:hypothetical protein